MSHREISYIDGSVARAERGSALVAAVLVTTLLATLGAGLILVTSTEMRVASAYHQATRALHAADAVLALALTGLAGARVDDVLRGVERSPFVDGAPVGVRSPVGGVMIDLDVLTQRLRCGRPRRCSNEERATVTALRPWGANNPLWQPYVYGPLNDLVPATEPGVALYVVAWVGDDELETDGDPTTDAALATDAGHGMVRLHVEAHGAAGQRRAMEALVRIEAAAVSVHSWKEVR